MRIILSISFMLLCGGCNWEPGRLLGKLAGEKTQQVVLQPTPMVISGTGSTFKSKAESMTVVGGDSAICVVLEKNISMKDRDHTERRYDELLNGAEFTVTLKTDKGEIYEETSMGWDWRAHGIISPSDSETSACVSCRCGPQPDVGDVISEITIKSSKPIKVLGVYWRSTNIFD